ncbi:MAG: O-methyltransferase [Acidobacteria bacterium]|nr:O-methyltransferase [Acidobacteriota bacterium]
MDMQEFITNPDVEQYMYSMLPPRDPVLQEMEALAQKRNIPIIGPVVARILYQLVRLAKAKTIFEMGSAIGYSTIWLARAAGEGSTVYYTDSDPENARMAANNFERAGVRDRIQILTGDALEMLDRTLGIFDVVFCDVEKQDYPRVFHKAVPRIRKGGLLLADNVLWYGRITQPPQVQDEATRGIVEFNRLIYSSPELYPCILPVRDGFAVCEKL